MDSVDGNTFTNFIVLLEALINELDARNQSIRINKEIKLYLHMIYYIWQTDGMRDKNNSNTSLERYQFFLLIDKI